MTLSTRKEIRREMLRRAGGFVETLTTVDDEQSAAADGMRYRFSGDDAAGKGTLLYEPTSAAADQLRVATGWDDSAGDATIDTVSVAWSANDVVEYYLRNDPTPHEFNEAINRALGETERIVETTLPTVEGQRNYSLLNAPWIDVRRDVQAVYHRESPNILDNSNFELWGRGSDAQLHGWTLGGTGGTVTRVDGLQGRYAVRLTRVGTNVTLTQTIPIPIVQMYGKSLSVFGRIKCGTASFATIDITDGTDTTSTSAHDGGGDWDEFTATHTVNADAVGPISVVLNGKTTDTNADFELVVMVEGSSVPEWLSKYGDQNARQKKLSWSPQMSSSSPAVRIARPYNRGSQIVVQSRQPYFKLSADTGVTGATDMPFETAVQGAIVKLAEIHSVGKPNAARWERLGAYWLLKYHASKRRLQEPSTQPDRAQVVLRGG